jgi:4-oxalocrotonate tautomerase
MPHITVQGPPLTVEQKRELGKSITEAAARVYGMPAEKFMMHIAEFDTTATVSGGRLISDKVVR